MDYQITQELAHRLARLQDSPDWKAVVEFLVLLSNGTGQQLGSMSIKSVEQTALYASYLQGRLHIINHLLDLPAIGRNAVKAAQK